MPRTQQTGMWLLFAENLHQKFVESLLIRKTSQLFSHKGHKCTVWNNTHVRMACFSFMPCMAMWTMIKKTALFHSCCKPSSLLICYISAIPHTHRLIEVPSWNIAENTWLVLLLYHSICFCSTGTPPPQVLFRRMSIVVWIPVHDPRDCNLTVTTRPPLMESSIFSATNTEFLTDASPRLVHCPIQNNADHPSNPIL